MTTSMTTHVYTDQQLFDGMDRLRRLHKMAQRRTHVDALPATFHEESPALRRGLPHWHPENIQAAVLYPVNATIFEFGYSRGAEECHISKFFYQSYRSPGLLQVFIMSTGS